MPAAATGSVLITSCDLRDGVLNKDAHEGVGGGDPTVLDFGDVEICFGVNRHEDPQHAGGDETDCHQGDECHISFVVEDARVRSRSAPWTWLAKESVFVTLTVLSSVSCARKKSSRL